MKRGRIVKLDVREDFQQGRHPFDKIMQGVAKLGAHDTLELLAPLKPTPLIGLLKNQGFQHEAVELPGGDWQVRFHRPVAAESAA